MTQFAYFEGRIRPIDEAKISIMNQTFNYGTGCFGGLRGYWSQQRQELNVIRIQDHFIRFLNSAKLLYAHFDYTPQQLADLTLDLLAREGWQQNVYIRPIAYKAQNGVGVRLHDLPDDIAIFSLPMGDYLALDKGLSVGTSSWRRVDDTMIPPRGKIIGAYVNSALIKTEAHLNGFDDAIVLNQDGHVAEASVANLIMVRNQTLIVPPAHANALEGITLKSILHLAQEELGLAVEERNIDRTELYYADEAFFCGTGVQIAAMTSLDHRPVGNGEIGPITSQIRDLYFRVVFGKVPKYHHWLTPVPASVPA